MRKTKDQKDLSEVLVSAQNARDAAHSLFGRRLDTRRNVGSFIALCEAFNRLKDACDVIEKAIEQATETKSSDQNSVSLEIMVRKGVVTGTKGTF